MWVPASDDILIEICMHTALMTSC